MHVLNTFLGFQIYDISANPTTVSKAMLPPYDLSYLKHHRDCYMKFIYSTVERVYTNDEFRNSIVTAGDRITINVKFTLPVMVYIPPVLMLNVGEESDQSNQKNGTAYFAGGNFTDTLQFAYVVQPGDTATSLDLIETLAEPYKLNTPAGTTMALNTNTELLQSFPYIPDHYIRDFFAFPDANKGGIFMASEFNRILIPANTQLPARGEPGSLSVTSNVQVDTSAPFITRVTTKVSSGTYGNGVILPIEIDFNHPVQVGGCPYLFFNIQNTARRAQFVDGNPSDVLSFEFNIQSSDYAIEWDYFDTNQTS